MKYQSGLSTPGHLEPQNREEWLTERRRVGRRKTSNKDNGERFKKTKHKSPSSGTTLAGVGSEADKGGGETGVRKETTTTTKTLK